METKPQKRDSPNLMANQGIAMKNQVLNNYQNAQKKTTTVGSNTTTTKTPTQTVNPQQTFQNQLKQIQTPQVNQAMQNAKVAQDQGAGKIITDSNQSSTNTQSIKNNQNLGKKLSNASSRFKDMTSSDGIDYKAKYEELINNPDVLCRPDGTPLPIEQQPPQVQEKIKKTETSIKNVTNPKPIVQEQPQPVEEPQEPTIEEPEVQDEVQETPTEQPQEETPTELATIEGENKEGLIYGRASGEAQQTIHTNADQYSADQSIQAERQKSLNNLQVMDSYNVAVSLANGYTPYGDQAMRDLQQYDPQKYQQIQDELKKIQVGEQINQIASGGKIDITSQTRAMTDTINNSIDDWAKNNSDSQSYDGTLNLLTSKLASSQTAQSATQEMLNINKDIAEIQTQMDNLPREAKKAFKGDVPQYLVDAYISNKSQELQTKLNTLQTRYAGLSDMYKTELANKQREAEMEMKQQQMVIQQNQRALEQEFKMSQQNWENNFKTNQFNWNVGQQNRENSFKQNQFNRQVGQQDRENQYKLKQYDLDVSQLKLSSMKTDSNGRVFQINSDGTYTYLSDNTAKVIMDQQIDTAIQTLMKKCPQGATGWQCEALTDEFNRATYGQEMLPRDKDGNPSASLGRKYTTAQEKKSYVNTPYLMKGATAVFNYTKSDGVSDDAVKYGHTALIVGIDEKNGTVTYLDGNRKGDEKVQYSTMKIEDFYQKTGLQGFRYPPYDKKLDTIQTNDITAQNNGLNFDESMTSLYSKLNSNKSLTKEDRATVDSYGITRPEFMQQATNYKKYLSEQMSPQAQEMIDTLQEIKNEMGRVDFVNASIGENGTRGTEGAYHRSLINKFVASKSLQNLIDMKNQGATFGALSDSELRFIADSATNLTNMNLSYGDYMKSIDQMIEKLQKGIDTSKQSNSGNNNERVNPRA